MRASFIQAWLRLRASYYFLPSLMAAGALLLATVTTRIDLRFQDEIADMLGWFYAGTTDGARSVLSAIAGSMISVAAVTFSLTMVAVTTAAGQYGPRLISNFMRDRANQVTLGTFLATFLYALMVLRAVSATRNDGMEGLVPSLSVLAALALTLISVGVLIHFIHHIPETLNVGTITGKVARKLTGQIENGVFPTHDGLEGKDCSGLGDPFNPALTQDVKTDQAGFVEAVSLEGLVEWAEEHSARIRLLCVPGDFLMTGDPVLEIVMDDASAPVDAKRNDTIRAFIAQGTERTAHQNALFLADELVEIAARALSPGVNDPFTAINCIHWYGEACLKMMQAPPAPHCLGQAEGAPRVWTRTVDFKRLCDVLFGQSRQYICEDENAARETLRTLYRLKDRVPSRHDAVLDGHIAGLKTAIAQSGLSDAQKSRLRNGPPFSY